MHMIRLFQMYNIFSEEEILRVLLYFKKHYLKKTSKNGSWTQLNSVCDMFDTSSIHIGLKGGQNFTI